MNYAEYMKSLGATEDDLKVLDTPLTRKAFDAMQADAEARVQNYKTEADNWYNNTILPNYQTMEQKLAAASANEARARALILASQDEGLKKVAADFYKDGGNPNPAPANPNPGNPGFDPNKYVTVDALQKMSDDVGAGLAALQDMVIEHSQLFPDRRLDVRAIRAEAVAARQNVYDYWQKKFDVPSARSAKEAAVVKSREDAIRKEEREKVTSELASTYGNPNTVPASSSSNVFAARPAVGRDKMPWEANLDGANGSNDRVGRAARNFVERQSAGRTN